MGKGQGIFDSEISTNTANDMSELTLEELYVLGRYWRKRAKEINISAKMPEFNAAMARIRRIEIEIKERRVLED